MKAAPWILSCAALALALPAAAEDACTLPGVLVLEDASNDSGVTPDPAVGPVGDQPFLDIQTVHMAEPTAMAGKLVFTYKLRDLSQLVPSTGYILRLSTNEAPADGYEDFFVAMFVAPDGSAQFEFGRTGFSVGLPAAEPRQFVTDGNLDGASAYNADGTITLVLDKNALPGIVAGSEVYNILPTVRIMVPTDPAGFRTNGANQTILDDTLESGYYQVGQACGGKDAVATGLAGTAGALSPLTLLGLLLLPALRRRR